MRAVERHTDTLESFGAPSQTTICTISLDGGLMRTLVSGLYSDGPKTVVREIIANALDSHIAAGKKNTPIEVWMPTQIDSYFTVRDFGTGMSDEFIREKYSALSYSSKTEDNSQTGAFGVGSKSPFAISDNFSIRCFDKNGTVRSYSIYFNEKQQIVVDLMYTSKAKSADRAELGGVEVRVPVAGKVNYKTMLDALKSQQAIYFDKNIKWDGVSKSNVTEWQRYVDITSEANGAILMGKLNGAYAYRGESFVRQGSAVYPLTYHKMEALPSSVSDLINHMLMNKSDLIFDVPIGTCDVTAARENLQYNDASVTNLIKFITDAVCEYAQKLRDIVGSETDAWAILDAMDTVEGVDTATFDPLRSAENRFGLAIACARIAPELPFVVKSPWISGDAIMQRRIRNDIFLDKDYDPKNAAIIVNNTHGSARKYSANEVARHDGVYIITKGMRDWSSRVIRYHQGEKGLRRAIVVRVRKDQIAHFYKIAKILFRNVVTESVLPAATPLVRKPTQSQSYPKFGHKGFHSGYDTLDLAVPGVANRDFYVVSVTKSATNKFFVEPIVTALGDACATNDKFVTESELRELLTKTIWLKEIVDNARVFRLTPNQFHKLKKSGKLPAQELTKVLADKFEKECSAVVPNYASLLNWGAASYTSVFRDLITGTLEERDVLRTIFKAFPFFATTYGINVSQRVAKTEREKTIDAVAEFLKIESATVIPVEIETYLSIAPITLPELRDDSDRGNPLMLKFFVAGIKSDKKWKPEMPPKALLNYYKKTLDTLEETV
jgi:Histidine kinase-, DNA gyrase B-, and HSP90-like ATPase